MIRSSMRPRNRLRHLPGGMVFALLLSAANAQQTGRDPTIAPQLALEARVPGSAAAAATDPGPLTVIVRDGQPFLVAGSRLVGVGQMLGEARIDRIGETEIWLREGGVLRKLPRYPGVTRLPSGKAQAPARP